MSGLIGASPIQEYVAYTKNEAKSAASFATTDPTETALTAYFKKNAATITTPAALLKNYKALTVVLGAFGLGDQINSTALLKQLLTQDPSSAGSTAHRIGSAKYLAFAKALHSWNPPPFATANGVNAIVKAYQLNSFETGVNTADNGLKQALYFTRIAGSITSYTQLQSDADLLAVAVTGLGLPLTAYDTLSFEQQTALLKHKLPIANLAKPAFVTHLAEQFLVQKQLAAGPIDTTPQAGSLLNAFSGSDSSAGSLLSILHPSTGNSTSGTASNSLLSLFA